jgi:4-amino-4-deoxy-L-arabinose transferase-like glycosyltransferase
VTAAENASSKDASREKWALRACLAAALGAVLPLVAQGIPEVDPAQYAEVARHILVTGRWGGLEDAFGPFLNKPPLAFWLAALCIRALGATSFAARLPSLLAGLGLCVATRRIGLRLWDARTGMLAAALTASSLPFALMWADPKIDMLLAACVAGAVACAVEARWRPAWMWAAWLLAALGFLAKGPVGFALPAFAVVPEAARRPWSEASTGRGLWARLQPLKLITGLPLATAVIAPFFVAQFSDWGWGGVRFHLWDQGIGRFFASNNWRNDAGPFFFVHTALWVFLPFTPVLGVALFQRARALWRSRSLPPDWRRLCGWWLGLTFLTISASSYKLPQYLYPAVPAAALLSARCLTELGPRPLRWLERVGYGLGALAATGAGFVLWRCFPAPFGAALLWLALLLLAPWVLSRVAAPGAVRTGAALVGALAGLSAFYAGHLHPALLAYQPGPRIGALAHAEDPAGRFLPFVGVEPFNAAGFYARRYLRHVDAAGLLELVREEHPRLAVLSEAAVGELSSRGWQVAPLERLPSFPISRPTRAFLLARSREATLQQLVVARIAPPPPG